VLTVYPKKLVQQPLVENGRWNSREIHRRRVVAADRLVWRIRSLRALPDVHTLSHLACREKKRETLVWESKLETTPKVTDRGLWRENAREVVGYRGGMARGAELLGGVESLMFWQDFRKILQITWRFFEKQPSRFLRKISKNPWNLTKFCKKSSCKLHLHFPVFQDYGAGTNGF